MRTVDIFVGKCFGAVSVILKDHLNCVRQCKLLVWQMSSGYVQSQIAHPGDVIFAQERFFVNYKKHLLHLKKRFIIYILYI